MIELLWNDPISIARMTTYIEALSLSSHHKVLDVGCGCGEVLIRMHERFAVEAIGIDSSAVHITEAGRRCEGRITNDAVRFIAIDACEYHVEPESFDLVVCMGSTHAFGLGSNAYHNAIEQIIPMVAKGGLLFVAEGYMKQPATAEYRKFLGDSMSDEMTHASNVETGKKLGLIPLAAWTSSDSEWDDFEWAYQRNIERSVAARPGDVAAQEKLIKRRQWMDAYLRWGRDTLGFGIYLFKKANR